MFTTITLPPPLPSPPPPPRLPLIVSSYQGPPELLAAVRREVDRWNKLGLRYFSVQFEQEMEQLNDSLKELHLRRLAAVYYMYIHVHVYAYTVHGVLSA